MAAGLAGDIHHVGIALLIEVGQLTHGLVGLLALK
jgi:hypothetical protein